MLHSLGIIQACTPFVFSQKDKYLQFIYKDVQNRFFEFNIS